jgi:RimJ/RimL family protein N-acetyltransferase
MIRGEKIYLRPVKQSDLALLESWNNDTSIEGEYNAFGLRPVGTVEKRFAEDGLIGARSGELLVINYDDEVVGMVSYHQVRYGPNDGSVVYNIGIHLVPEHRGKGYGGEAQRLLATYLFAVYPIMRVEATTDIENIPEQKALEKVGFRRDGVMRKAQWRTGDWHDMVVYSKLRGE